MNMQDMPPPGGRLIPSDRTPTHPPQPDGPVAAMRDVLRAARRRAVPLSLWVTGCLAVGVYQVETTPPAYTATATVLLEPRRQIAASLEGSASGQIPTLDSAQAESQLQVIRSEGLLKDVFGPRGLADDPELAPGGPGLVDRILGREAVELPEGIRRTIAFGNFASRVGARRIGQSYVVEISYTSSDRQNAQRVANAIVSAYLGQQVALKAAAARDGSEFLQHRVIALGNEVKAAQAGVIAGTTPEAALSDADSRVIGAAEEPLSRSAPKTGIIMAFAGAFGLLSGLFAVAVGNGFDHRVRDRRRLRRDTDLSCLGTLPRWRRRGRDADPERTLRREAVEGESDFADAMRATRTGLMIAAGTRRSHVIAITSCKPGAGKTVVAHNLAHLLAASGQNVTLVDAALDRTGRAEEYGWSVQGPALSDGLVDEAVMRTMRPSEVAPHLAVIPAVRSGRKPDRAAYLGATSFVDLLGRLRQEGDVVIDLPSLATSHDARAAAGMANGVVLVIEGGRTTIDEIVEAKHALCEAGANILGVVINKASAEA